MQLAKRQLATSKHLVEIGLKRTAAKACASVHTGQLVFALVLQSVGESVAVHISKLTVELVMRTSVAQRRRRTNRMHCELNFFVR